MSKAKAPAAPPSNQRELFRDGYIAVRLEADGALVRLTRSAAAYDSITELISSFEQVIAALDRVGRKGRGMLFDTRLPRGRNDPEFELAMARLRPRIDRDFARIGVLVTSAVGSLQMRRWVSTDGIERIAGTDEAAILEIIFAGLPSRKS